MTQIEERPVKASQGQSFVRKGQSFSVHSSHKSCKKVTFSHLMSFDTLVTVTCPPVTTSDFFFFTECCTSHSVKTIKSELVIAGPAGVLLLLNSVLLLSHSVTNLAISHC